MKRVIDFLKKAEVYYLATVEGNQPRVRPFGTINEFEGRLYIQTGKIKPTSHQLAENPRQKSVHLRTVHGFVLLASLLRMIVLKQRNLCSMHIPISVICMTKTTAIPKFYICKTQLLPSVHSARRQK